MKKKILACLLALSLALNFTPINCMADIASDEKSSFQINQNSTQSNDTSIIKLPENTIMLDSDTVPCMQILCESLGGIYFLNTDKPNLYSSSSDYPLATLSFYDTSANTLTAVTTFKNVIDIYQTDTKLYVLRTDWTYENSSYDVIIFDLLTQKSEKVVALSNCNLPTAIGADSSGRVYLSDFESGSYYIKLFSADLSTVLSSTAVESIIYRFSGFDSTNGNFYYEGYYNYVYWGYPHDCNVLKSGNVTNNTLTVKDDYVELLYQIGFYPHNNSSVLLDNKYLATTSTRYGQLMITNSNEYDIDAQTLPTVLSVSRAGYENDFYESTGTRTVYNKTNDSFIFYANSNIIVEYDKSPNELSRFYTKYPVFSLINSGNKVIAIEKNDDDFYIETINWKQPESVTLSGNSSIKVNESSQIYITCDSQLAPNYTWSSSDNSIATVSESGKVYGVSAGVVTITANATDNVSGTIVVTVKANDEIVTNASSVTTTGIKSDNIDMNTYTTWSKVVTSYLYENQDKTLTRVESMSDGVNIEKFSRDGKSLIESKTIANELEIFGGFYNGNENNYLVFGQNNSDESDEIEVVRVVKYTKDWKRISACSIKGANTYIPFDAGSLRMIEKNGELYVYTCHEMYDDDDSGYHHQANMIFQINEEAMTLTDSYYDVMNISQAGYVSHSFNQFICADDNCIYRVDQGDMYPRAVSIIKSTVGSSITSVSYTTKPFTYNYDGYSNFTGASIGGFELSESGCIIVGNSIKDDSHISVRNVFVSITDKLLNNNELIYLTDFDVMGDVTAYTPQLVKINDNTFLVMWNEYNSATKKSETKVLLIDGKGNKLTSIYKANVKLSDCQPVLCSDNNVRWYVTDSSSPTIYTVNPYNLSALHTHEKGTLVSIITKPTYTSTGIGLYKCSVCGETFESDIPMLKKKNISSVEILIPYASYTYTGTALTPAVTVKDGTKTLVIDTDYTVAYSANTNVGTATVTITGKGNYTGTITKSFKIVAKNASTSTISDIANQTYTGVALTPAVTVKDGTKVLVANTDYTVAYSANTNVGTATVTITGKGNYTGTATKTFKIVAKNASAFTVSYIANQTYTGIAKTPAIIVKDGTKTLVKNTDYTVSYSANTNVGTATVTITGKGNYTGTATKTFIVVEKNASTLTVSDIANQTYTGSALTPAIIVKDGTKTLVKNTDYTVSYSANTNVGTATVTITGKGNYTGTATKTFTIVAKYASSFTVSDITNQTYTGFALVPAVTVKDGTKALVKDTDYTVTYSANTNVGTATVTITGKGNYTGTATKTFKIVAKNASAFTVSDIANQTYTGSALVPAVTVKDGTKTLVKDTDYTVKYSANTNVGTATVTITGKGNYTGTATKTFTIAKKSISAMTATLSTTNYTYSGTAKNPSVTLKNGTKTLVKNTDYTVSYSANKNVGTATVIITGKGNYSGTIKKTFTIVKASNSFTLTCPNVTYGTALSPKTTGVKGGAKVTYYYKVKGTADKTYTKTKPTKAGTYTVKAVSAATANYKSTTKTVYVTIAKKSISAMSASLSTTNYTYTDSAKKPSVTLKNGTKVLAKNTDYTVSYSANVKCGKGTVTITGKGNYTGTIKKHIYIKPAKVTGVGTSARATTSITLKWKKSAGSVTGYEIYQAKGNSGTYTKIATITGASTVTYKKTGLTSGTDYKYKVRAYKKIGTTKYYGSYSSINISGTKTKAPTISSLTAGSKKVTAKWGKVSGADGYQIAYATSKTGTYKTVTVTSSSTLSKTISSLTKGKTYYFKVRGYITINGAKVYSSYSSIKSIKSK